MPRIAWLTDLHLNAASPDRVAQLVARIEEHAADLVLIGGDIGEAPSFVGYLNDLAERVTAPIAFVLGNHDYYRGSIARVREQASVLSRESNRLTWLPDAGVVSLTGKTALVGHGGWGDGRCGDFLGSDVLLNDYLLIDELRLDIQELQGPRMLPSELLGKLNALGDEAAAHFQDVLPTAFEKAEHVFVLMHVPPFREACWHQGRISDDNWSPHFTCKAVGDVLLETMQERPDRRMTVLCGHTHGAGHAQILPNLEVITGPAEYGEPAVQRVFDVE